MNSINLAPIPDALRWQNPPISWNVNDNGVLTITTGATTDLFTDPQGALTINNSPRLMFQPQGSFILSARVKVDFTSKYDAGVLMLYANEKHWAKLCFEFSPQRQPMVVSVVNRDYSDDCNSHVVDGSEVYLRVARLDSAYAFHASDDGHAWSLIRYFSLGADIEAAVGFSTQSPTGQACTATFDEIRYEARKLEDIRSGE